MISATASCLLFDSAQQRWLPTAPLLEARRLLTVAWLESAAYAAGGWGRTPRADVERLDPRQGHWLSVAPLPRAVHSAATVVLGEHTLCMIGGYSSERLAGSLLYDARADSWSAASDSWRLPEPRSAHRAFIVS